MITSPALHRTLRCNSSGFHTASGVTLPEILLASVIMVLAIVPIVGVFKVGLGGQQMQIRQMTGIQIAQDYMNQCLAASFDETTVDHLGAEHEENRGGVEYTITIEVQHFTSVSFSFKERAPVPTDPPVQATCSVPDSLKKVTVEVTWPGRADTDKSFALKSFKSRIKTN